MIERQALLAGAAAVHPTTIRAQQKTIIKVARHRSFIYMPTFIMKTGMPVRTHSARLGMLILTAAWVTLNG